jgi:L-alanine-DL-glutamate epimerase-like enolase superfamily enzyme
MDSLKIRSVHFFEATSPLSRPIADATHAIPAIRFLVARVTLEDGTVGEGYLLAFHFAPRAIRGALADIGALAIGFPANATAAFNRACDEASEYFGDVGLLRWARGVVNIAMWDAWARHLGTPVGRLLGTPADRVPAYGSGGWLSYSIDELLDEVRGYARRGFAAVKIKVGSRERERDVERVARVREAVGPHLGVMIDANQGLDLPAALELAQRVRDFGIGWFEEPLPHTDFAGYEALRRDSGLPIAMGEREYDLVALRELAGRKAIDLWQPDILRLGGVEGWLESAALAASHGLPVLAHYYKEYDTTLSCVIPNARGVESFDWVDGLIDHPVRIEHGHAYPSDAPGWGFRFKDEALTEIGPIKS